MKRACKDLSGEQLMRVAALRVASEAKAAAKGKGKGAAKATAKAKAKAKPKGDAP